VTSQEALSRLEMEQELVWRACARSFLYFFEHIWFIQLPKRGAIRPTARPFQIRLAETLEKGGDEAQVIALKARQIGFTTVVAAFAVWTCLFRPDIAWLFVSRNEKAAQRNLRRATYGIERLPAWFQRRMPKIVAQSTEKITFDNESRIESLPASGASGRGDSVYGILFDEAAHMDNPDELYASLEPLCYGPFLVFSSANGMGNWFHLLWLEAKMPDSAWVPMFCSWREAEMRDDAWYARTKMKYRGQLWLFYQEYPSDDTEAFARSGRVAYGGDVTKYMEFTNPLWRFVWTGTAFDLEHPVVGEEEDLELRVWKQPEVERYKDGRLRRKPNYVVFCDAAEGLEHGDYSAVAVWNANTKEVVATIRTHFPIEYMADVLAWLGHWYCTALLMVERNNHGLVPITELSRHFNYPRQYRMAAIAQQVQGDRTPRWGWHTNRSTKPKMVLDFLRALRDQTVLVNDPVWDIERSTFVADGSGGFAAQPPNHDDLMMAVIGGWQGVLDVGEYPIIWQDPVPGPPTWADVLRVTQPVGPQGRMKVGRGGGTVVYSRPSVTLQRENLLDGQGRRVTDLSALQSEE
jgi:hypothetical protein